MVVVAVMTGTKSRLNVDDKPDPTFASLLSSPPPAPREAKYCAEGLSLVRNQGRRNQEPEPKLVLVVLGRRRRMRKSPTTPQNTIRKISGPRVRPTIRPVRDDALRDADAARALTLALVLALVLEVVALLVADAFVVVVGGPLVGG